MNFGFNFGFLGSGLGGGTTNCFNPLVKNGDMIGFDTSIPFGSIDPSETPTHQVIYAVYADTSNGDFVIRFGALGNEKVSNTDHIVITFDIHNINYHLFVNWNVTNNRYEGNDKNASDAWLGEVGNNSCINISAIPKLLIYYNFRTLGVT